MNTPEIKSALRTFQALGHSIPPMNSKTSALKSAFDGIVSEYNPEGKNTPELKTIVRSLQSKGVRTPALNSKKEALSAYLKEFVCQFS